MTVVTSLQEIATVRTGLFGGASWIRTSVRFESGTAPTMAAWSLSALRVSESRSSQDGNMGRCIVGKPNHAALLCSSVCSSRLEGYAVW